MGRVWSSDLHIGHFNVISYCNRPFSSVEEMNEEIIKRHNEKVTMEDLWVFCGDFAMNVHNIPKYLSRFNFKEMVWLAGNHDKKLEKMLIRWHEETGDCRQVMWQDSLTRIMVGLKQVNISHYPYKGGGDSGYEERFTERRLDDNGLVLIHGHSHRPPDKKISFTKWGTLQIDCGVDGNNFYPYTEEELKDLIYKSLEPC